MKIQGRKIEGPEVKTIVLPRKNGNLIFDLQAVLDTDEFDKICSVPKPPVKISKGGTKTLLTSDAKYQKRLKEWGLWKTNWMFLQSISATKGLEFETVDPSDPSTWGNFEKELKVAGITEAERLRILRAYIEVQGLDDAKIEEATKSFLAFRQEEKEQGVFQNTEQSDMPSGEPVKD